MSCLRPLVGVQNRTAEKVIGSLATSAHGVVTRARLLEAGVTAKEIEQRPAISLRSSRAARRHRR